MNREGGDENIETDTPLDLSSHQLVPQIPLEHMTVENVVVSEEFLSGVMEEALDLSAPPRPPRRLNRDNRQVFVDPLTTLPGRNVKRRDAQTQTYDGTFSATNVPLGTEPVKISKNVTDSHEESILKRDSLLQETANVYPAVVEDINAFCPRTPAKNVIATPLAHGEVSCNMNELIKDGDLLPASVSTLNLHHIDQESKPAVSANAGTNEEVASPSFALTQTTTIVNLAAFQEGVVQGVLDGGDTLEVANTVTTRDDIVLDIVYPPPTPLPSSISENVSGSPQELGQMVPEGGTRLEVEAAVLAKTDTAKKDVVNSLLATAQESTTLNLASFQEGEAVRGSKLKEAITVVTQDNVVLDIVYPSLTSLSSNISVNESDSPEKIGHDVPEGVKLLEEKAAIADNEKDVEKSMPDSTQAANLVKNAVVQKEIVQCVSDSIGHLVETQVVETEIERATSDPVSNCNTAPVSPADSNASVVEFHTVDLVILESESEGEIYEIFPVNVNQKPPSEPGTDQVALNEEESVQIVSVSVADDMQNAESFKFAIRAKQIDKTATRMKRGGKLKDGSQKEREYKRLGIPRESTIPVLAKANLVEEGNFLQETFIGQAEGNFEENDRELPPGSSAIPFNEQEVPQKLGSVAAQQEGENQFTPLNNLLVVELEEPELIGLANETEYELNDDKNVINPLCRPIEAEMFAGSQTLHLRPEDFLNIDMEETSDDSYGLLDVNLPDFQIGAALTKVSRVPLIDNESATYTKAKLQRKKSYNARKATRIDKNRPTRRQDGKIKFNGKWHREDTLAKRFSTTIKLIRVDDKPQKTQEKMKNPKMSKGRVSNISSKGKNTVKMRRNLPVSIETPSVMNVPEKKSEVAKTRQSILPYTVPPTSETFPLQLYWVGSFGKLRSGLGGNRERDKPTSLPNGGITPAVSEFVQRPVANHENEQEQNRSLKPFLSPVLQSGQPVNDSAVNPLTTTANSSKVVLQSKVKDASKMGSAFAPKLPPATHETPDTIQTSPPEAGIVQNAPAAPEVVLIAPIDPINELVEVTTQALNPAILALEKVKASNLKNNKSSGSRKRRRDLQEEKNEVIDDEHQAYTSNEKGRRISAKSTVMSNQRKDNKTDASKPPRRRGRPPTGVKKQSETNPGNWRVKKWSCCKYCEFETTRSDQMKLHLLTCLNRKKEDPLEWTTVVK